MVVGAYCVKALLDGFFNVLFTYSSDAAHS
jgi:hypothetical protein